MKPMVVLSMRTWKISMKWKPITKKIFLKRLSLYPFKLGKNKNEEISDRNFSFIGFREDQCSLFIKPSIRNQTAQREDYFLLRLG